MGGSGTGGNGGSEPGTGGAAWSSTGGGATGGVASSGGNPGSGGSDGTGGGLAEEYPCDGSTSGYDAVVTGSGSNWSVDGSSYGSLHAAITAALSSGGESPNNKRKVLVQDSGSMPNNQRLDVPSNTVLNVCGTIDVTSAGGSGDMAPVYARNRSHIDVPHLTVTGSPVYGMFFRRVSNLHLGKIELQMSGGGIGIRIDNEPEKNCWGRCNHVTEVTLDDVYVSGNGGHGVETYGVDGLSIGTVTARDVGNAGLLLNATINATVGTVDAEDTATGTGYAAFRVANEAGKIDASWPAGNIHVGLVRARRGGRGIFCVSDSGGTTIDRVDIADTGNDSMLLENCHNMRVAAESGSVSGSKGIWITYRPDEHTPSTNVTLQNLEVASNITIGESRCGTNILVCNISGGPNIDVCDGTLQDSCP